MTHTGNDTTTALAFLEELRSETKELHKRLEELSISKAIVSPNITPEIYVSYLNLMQDVVRDTEGAVFPKLSSIIEDINQRRKLDWIESDLKVSGGRINQNQTGINDEFSVPFAFGIMYVVEGSSLGGRFILKNVETVLGYSAENGAKYFSGYGEKTGSSWKNFLKTLTEYEAEHQCGEEVIAGANFAFETIHNHFQLFKNEN